MFGKSVVWWNSYSHTSMCWSMKTSLRLMLTSNYFMSNSNKWNQLRTQILYVYNRLKFCRAKVFVWFYVNFCLKSQFCSLLNPASSEIHFAFVVCYFRFDFLICYHKGKDLMWQKPWQPCPGLITLWFDYFVFSCAMNILKTYFDTILWQRKVSMLMLWAYLS